MQNDYITYGRKIKSFLKLTLVNIYSLIDLL
jgi:hypothetical protein